MLSTSKYSYVHKLHIRFKLVIDGNKNLQLLIITKEIESSTSQGDDLEVISPVDIYTVR